MHDPTIELPSANAAESPLNNALTETNDSQIDNQMRLLVRRLGELVGRTLAVNEQSGNGRKTND